MAPTKVSDKAIEKALSDAVRNVYQSDEREQLSVNYARQLVEEKFGLESGFLKEGNWKSKSRDLIRAALVGSAFE